MTGMTDHRLGTEHITRLFFSMTAPVILQQFILLLNSVVDRIWIAHIPDVGELAFTASGVCVPVVYLILALVELVGTGISPRVGYLLGSDNRPEAERTLGAMLVFDLLLAVSACLFIEWQCHWLISLFGGSPQTFPLAETYLRISTPGNTLCLLSGGLAPFLLVQGRSREAGFVMSIGIVLNMLLDPIFIFVFEWGIAGAAWATTIAETAAAIAALYCILGKDGLKLRKANLRPKSALLWPCLALGITPMAMMLAEAAQIGIYNATLAPLGGDVAIGTMALVIMLHDFLYFPVYGMAYGAQPVTSYNLGAGQTERVRQNVRLLLRATLLWSLAVWVVMEVATGPVVRLVVGDGEMAEWAVPMVRISFALFFVATLQFACQSILQAMGRPAVTFWLGLSHTLLLLVPLVWLLPRLLPGRPANGIFLAQPLTDLLVGAATFLCLYRTLIKLNTSIK